jgi:hypothetical protein
VLAAPVTAQDQPAAGTPRTKTTLLAPAVPSKPAADLLPAALVTAALPSGRSGVGDPLLGQGSGEFAYNSGQGWIVTSDERSRGSRGAIIWHVPPRGGASELGVQPGQVRLAGDVHSMPTAIAAVGDRLFMFFDDKPDIPPAKPREVLSVTAVSSGVQQGLTGTQAWVTRPLGRYDAEPSLRSDGELLAATGTDDSVVTLLHGLREESWDPTSVTLYKLRVGGSGPPPRWERIILPTEITTFSRGITRIDGNRVSMPAKWSLLGLPGGVLVAAQTAAPRTGWRWWNISFAPTGENVIIRSQGTLLPFPAEGSSEVFPPSLLGVLESELFAVDSQSPGRLVTYDISKNGDKLPNLRASLSAPAGTAAPISPAPGPLPGAQTPAVTGDAVSAPSSPVTGAMNGPLTGALIGGPSITFHAMVLGPALPDRAPQLIGDGRSLREVSASTGRLLFAGTLTPTSPVTVGDYRMLGLLMALTIATAIAFLGKRPGDVSVSLPAKTALAAPVARVLASSVDLIAACIIGTSLWRTPLASLWDSQWWGTATSLWTFVTILAVGIVLNAVLESATGRSLGKIFAGIYVVQAFALERTPRDPFTRAQPRVAKRLSIVRSLARNALKWLSPLVALAGILTLTRRHRGDEWAVACVVEFLADEDENEEETDSRNSRDEESDSRGGSDDDRRA